MHNLHLVWIVHITVTARFDEPVHFRKFPSFSASLRYTGQSVVFLRFLTLILFGLIPPFPAILKNCLAILRLVAGLAQFYGFPASLIQSVLGAMFLWGSQFMVLFQLRNL